MSAILRLPREQLEQLTPQVLVGMVIRHREGEQAAIVAMQLNDVENAATVARLTRERDEALAEVRRLRGLTY